MTPPTFVTGPQRSGTTIAARIIAAEHNKSYVDELDFNPNSDLSNTVIQMPSALDSYIPLYYMFPGVVFVGITRDKADIIQSMKRIDWLRDDVQDWEQFLDAFVTQRFELWNQLKQKLPQDSWQEIPYDSLSQHPLFLSKQARADFSVRQWQLGKPCGFKTWANNYQCTLDKHNGRQYTGLD